MNIPAFIAGFLTGCAIGGVFGVIIMCVMYYARDDMTVRRDDYTVNNVQDVLGEK